MLLALARGLRRSLDGSGAARCDAASDPSAGSVDLRRFETLPPEDSAKLLEVEATAAPSAAAEDAAAPSEKEDPGEEVAGLHQATEMLQRRVQRWSLHSELRCW